MGRPATGCACPHSRGSRALGPIAHGARRTTARSVSLVANTGGRAERRRDTCIVGIAVFNANAVYALGFVPHEQSREAWTVSLRLLRAKKRGERLAARQMAGSVLPGASPLGRRSASAISGTWPLVLRWCGEGRLSSAWVGVSVASLLKWRSTVIEGKVLLSDYRATVSRDHFTDLLVQHVWPDVVS